MQLELLKVGIAASRATTTDEVIGTLVAELQKLGIPSIVGRIDGMQLRFIARTPGQPFLAQLEHVLGRPLVGIISEVSKGGIAQRAFLSGAALVYSDLSGWMERFLSSVPAINPRVLKLVGSWNAPDNAVLMPLVVRGIPWGVVFVAADTEWLMPSDIDVATILAQQISVAIECAEREEDLRREVRQLRPLLEVERFDESQRATIALLDARAELMRVAMETKSVNSVVDAVLNMPARLFGANLATVYLEAEGRLVLAGQRATGLGYLPEDGHISSRDIDAETFVGRVALSRKSIVTTTDNAPKRTRDLLVATGIRIGLATPILLGERLIGTLGTASADENYDFSPDVISAFEELAASLGVAVQYARYYEDEMRRDSDLGLINELGRLVSQHLSTQEIFATGIRYLQLMADVPNVFILTINEEEQTIRFEAANVAMEEGVVFSTSVPSVPGMVIRTGEPLAVENVSESTLVHRGLAEQFGHKAVLAVPIVADGRAVGAVVLGETRRPRHFTKAEVRRVLAISNQLGAALTNARLFEDLRRSYTELAHAQAQLVSKERLAALGELSAIMAHEVRNPLGVMFNSIGTLRKHLKPDGNVRMLLDILEEEASRLNRIVGELLDFARPFDPLMIPVDANEIVANAVRACLHAFPAARAHVRLVPSEGNMHFLADEQLLRQALINLVTNAIQAVQKTGDVQVLIKRRETVLGPYVVICISDTGHGMDEQVRERIFQPFFTTKPMGTGLGLAVVKRIIEALNGEISVESTVGQGASFSLTFPEHIRQEAE